jgi:DNA primase
MVKFPREFVREVVDRTSIVSLVSQTVRLKRRGNAWLGLCPFHNEKTPSFHVNEDRKNYHCFGCSKSGDAIDWLQEVEGLGFLDAVKELANRAGIAVPQEQLTPEQVRAAEQRDALMRANEVACRYFQDMLEDPQQGAHAREYLAGRGYSMEFAREWRIGFAPESWDGMLGRLRRERLPPEIGVEAGVLKRGDRGPYDFFRNRLMFPILGSGKKVIAFGGRTLGDDKAKYINTPETPFYTKSSALYGLHENRGGIHKEDRVLIVEGYFDVLALASAGLGFAVAPCGTALTDRQLAGIRPHTLNVTMLFDADEAGRRAALRTLEMCLDQGLWPQRLQVDGGKDPDEYLQEHGPEAMRALLDQGKPLLDFFIDTLAEDLRAGRSTTDKALEEAAPMLARLGEGNARYENYERQVIQAIGEHTDPRSIKLVVRQAAKRLATQPRRTEVELARRKTYTGELRGEARPSPPPAPRRPDTARRVPQGLNDWDDFVPPDDDEAPPPDALDGIDFDAPVPPFAATAQPAPPERPPTPPQLKLLRLLVQDLDNVARAVTDYGVEAWIDQPTVLKVVQRFLEASRTGRQPTSTDLIDDVRNPAVRSVVGESLASDASWYGRDILEAATQECLLRLRREYVARRYVQVKRDLDALQRSSSPGPEILALSQESLVLQKEREELDGHLRRS